MAKKSKNSIKVVKKATGKVGGMTPPKKAIPTAKRGGSTKSKMC